MDRRFLTVLGISLVFALVVSSIFYQVSARGTTTAKRPEKVDVKDVVVAVKPLGVGVNVKPDDVKVMKVPIDQFPKGAFSKVDDVLDRAVISNILLDEPVLDGRLASRGAGFGLAPMIPNGMRAVTVKVNEVVGVAGFVLPGMRVDVLVTGKPPGSDGMMTTTALQNMVVLSAGQTMQPDARGQAINAVTVTLLATPDQAEVLTLAGNEGRIQLVLRNGGDQGIQKTAGRDIAELFGRKSRNRAADDEARPRPKPVRVAAADPPPAPVYLPPPPPPPDEVITFRGTVRSVEVIGGRRN